MLNMCSVYDVKLSEFVIKGIYIYLCAGTLNTYKSSHSVVTEYICHRVVMSKRSDFSVQFLCIPIQAIECFTCAALYILMLLLTLSTYVRLIMALINSTLKATIEL